ncbi:MAG: hypothetical protein ACKVZ0_16180 [Gemmatimonadales bacterium]
MRAGTDWIVERLEELQARLGGVRALSESVPVIPAGSPAPRALAALEAGVGGAVRCLRREVARTTHELRRKPLAAWHGLYRANQRLAMLQLNADSLFRTLDLFADGIASRADASMGLLLAGADRVVAAALARPVPGYTPPLAVTYLDSAGRGGAIARARTELPGGVVLPIALIRVSPETLPTRLTSLLHEAGHQLNSDLSLLSEGAAVIRGAAGSVVRDAASVDHWASFTSELLADLWGSFLGGEPAVDGLQRVLSLPGALLFLIKPGDPHPPGMVRVAFAIECSRRIHPDTVLSRLEKRFHEVYLPTPVPRNSRESLADLIDAVPAVVNAILEHRFEGLGGRTMRDVCDPRILAPREVRRGLATLLRDPARLAAEPPLLGLARLGYARLLDLVTPLAHDDLARRWLQAVARQRFAAASTPTFRQERSAQ